MKNNFKQNRVSATVWPWLTPNEKGQFKRQALTTALLMLAVSWAISGMFYYWDHIKMSLLVLCVSSFVFFTSQCIPSLFYKIESVFQKLSYYIGLMITWVTLVPFYYLCFTTVHLLHLLRNVDPMTRKYIPESDSYWEDKKEDEGLENYRRQF
jgi:CDP-diglyceride synthetase